MKKLAGIMLLIMALTGCGVSNSIDAEDAALGFQLCQVFQVNPITVERVNARYRTSNISHSVKATCEAGLTVVLDVPYKKENPKGNV